MKTIHISENVPAPIGPYSIAVSKNNFIFTSGQIGMDVYGNLVDGGIKGQTKQVLENLKAILDEGGSSLEHILKTTVFLKDIIDFAEMNEVYGQYLMTSAPARSTVEVCNLPKGALVMIDVIAYK